jgi:hypothetical protein
MYNDFQKDCHKRSEVKKGERCALVAEQSQTYFTSVTKLPSRGGIGGVCNAQPTA